MALPQLAERLNARLVLLHERRVGLAELEQGAAFGLQLLALSLVSDDELLVLLLERLTVRPQLAVSRTRVSTACASVPQSVAMRRAASRTDRRSPPSISVMAAPSSSAPRRAHR